MNKLIILPGNSTRNKIWGEGVSTQFGNWFDSVYLQHYNHWESGQGDINFEAELDKLSQEIKQSSSGTSFFVFAKSAGTLLALQAVHKGLLTPKQSVFFGLPLDWAERDVFKGDWTPLTTFSGPAIAFHNDNDPTANYGFTKNTIAQHGKSSIEFFELVGNDHSYADFSISKTTIEKFLNLDK